MLPFSFCCYFQEITVSPVGVAALTTPQVLIHHMQGHSIHCIASGGQAPKFKFFFFAQKAEESSNYLVECIINSSTCQSQVKIKADDQSTLEEFSALFQSALSQFGLPWFFLVNLHLLLLLLLWEIVVTFWFPFCRHLCKLKRKLASWVMSVCTIWGKGYLISFCCSDYCFNLFVILMTEKFHHGT